jgi:hypothetical protein
VKTKYQSILPASGAKTSSQAIKSIRPIRRVRPAVGLNALLLVILFLASPVKGQCPKGWAIYYLDFMQDNQAQRNELSLSFNGGRFTGTAMYMTANRSSQVEGKVAGWASADKIHFEISWSNGLTGVYDATIRPRGQITGGMGYEKRSPSKKVRWSTTRLMECRD